MRNIQWMAGLPYELPPILDITEDLTRHKTKSYAMRSPEEITNIIIHHTVTTAPIENIAKSHVNNDGWPGLGYHLIISNNRVYQVNDLNSASYHAKGWNDKAIGIAIHADLTKRSLTEFERMLMYGAILTVKSLYPSITRILGHNEASKELHLPGTLCPATDCNRIRQDVVALETQIAYEQSPEAIHAKAYEVANNVKWLYNLANGKDEYGNAATPEQRGHAVRKLMQLYPAFKEAGLMK